MKILNIVGARPNFMKIAPLINEMRARRNIEALLVHTGQHYDEKLSNVFFEELGIGAPDINLEVGSSSREEQIERIKEAFRPVMAREKPALVLVVGDVNSTIACAEVAKEFDVRVAHVEAGLRSFDERMPEELNRVATDRISDYLFVTEESGMENLKREGVAGKSYLVGNVMIDNLVRHFDRAKTSTIISDLNLNDTDYIVSTFHRPSNVDDIDNLRRVLDVIRFITERTTLVLPLHPRTRSSLERHDLMDQLRSFPRMVLTEPLGYLDFLQLSKGALAVVTDSGGVQEETTYLQVPCITLRENTERPVTVTLGSNVLVGAQFERIYDELEKLFNGERKKSQTPPFWDGKTSERIVSILEREFYG